MNARDGARARRLITLKEGHVLYRVAACPSVRACAHCQRRTLAEALHKFTLRSTENNAGSAGLAL